MGSLLIVGGAPGKVMQQLPDILGITAWPSS